MGKRKGTKLTELNQCSTNLPGILTTANSLPFTVCLRNKLEKGYDFNCLEKRHLKDLQRFLDKVSGLSITDAEKLYLRPNTDKGDTKRMDDQELQVVHFGVTDKFRLHGYYEGDLFIVCRLDPEHKYHK